MPNLYEYIIDVPNFPKKGVTFKDITPLLEKRLPQAIDAIQALYPKSFWKNIDAIVGIEARGFMFGAALADRLNIGFIPARKAGKLPPPVMSFNYVLEYGPDTIEMKEGSGNVVIIDDILATGGTLTAAADLCEVAGYNVKGLACLLNLKYLNDFSWNDLQCKSVLNYD